MNVITEIRTGIADALKAGGVPAKTYVPANLFYPLALVGSGSPYVTQPVDENPFRKRHSVTITVLLIASDSKNESAMDRMDGLIVDAIDALETADWDVTEVDTPFDMTSEDGNTYTAALLTVVTNTNIEKDV